MRFVARKKCQNVECVCKQGTVKMANNIIIQASPSYQNIQSAW